MLNKIVETKKEEIKVLQLPDQEDVVRISFYEALKNRTYEIGLIAEVKKASPSKGVIREDFHPVEIAKGYEAGGANAISVLTDRTYFQGAPEYLTNIKKETKIPALRKDFLIEHIQVEESRRIGADAILLIAEILEAQKLHELYLHAQELGLDALVEVYSQQSLENVLEQFTPNIIGINNRDLTTFTTSLEQTAKIAPYVPKEALLVSESAIFTPEDLEYVKEAGAQAVLVGESLMRNDSPEEGVRKLFRKYVKQS